MPNRGCQWKLLGRKQRRGNWDYYIRFRNNGVGVCLKNNGRTIGKVRVKESLGVDLTTHKPLCFKQCPIKDKKDKICVYTFFLKPFIIQTHCPLSSDNICPLERQALNNTQYYQIYDVVLFSNTQTHTCILSKDDKKVLISSKSFSLN